MAGLRNRANIGPSVAVLAVAFVTVFSLVSITDANRRATQGVSAATAESDRLSGCRYDLLAQALKATGIEVSAQSEFLKAAQSGVGVDAATFNLDAAKLAKQDAERALDEVDEVCYRR